MQFFANRDEKFERGYLWVKHDSHVRVGRHSIEQQCSDERRLAGTHFAG